MEQQFIDRWEFTRGETVSILSNLNDQELAFKPTGETWQSMAWQFSCCARTQMIYTQAIQNNFMDFSLFSSSQFPSKSAFTNKDQLMTFLQDADRAWLQTVDAADPTVKIKWPDNNIPLTLHISNLLEHERMHLGQLISYHTLANISLPNSFRRNWAL